MTWSVRVSSRACGNEFFSSPFHRCRVGFRTVATLGGSIDQCADCQNYCCWMSTCFARGLSLYIFLHRILIKVLKSFRQAMKSDRKSLTRMFGWDIWIVFTQLLKISGQLLKVKLCLLGTVGFRYHAISSPRPKGLPMMLSGPDNKQTMWLWQSREILD